MLILQSTAASLSEGYGKALGKFQELAEQVICYSEDMECMPDRPDLMRLRTTLLSKLSLKPDYLPHKNKDMWDFLCKWAAERLFTIELDQRLIGPQVLWVQGKSGISAPEDGVFFFLVIRQPKSRDADPADESIPRQEHPSKALIKSPVWDNLVERRIQCQVGDIIVLEGGEAFMLCEEGGVCLVGTLYYTAKMDKEE